MPSPRNLAVPLVLSAALLALPGEAGAFNTGGHVVIEALAYRTLVEGHGTQPARPDVLRDLINDGALMPPVCFGRAEAEECRDVAVANPLLAWPQPRSDRPDAAFRRQFSDEGQCFHFMATAADEASPPIPGTRIPRDLATRAVVRCRDLLDRLLDGIVEVGGRETREGGFGLYEFVHSVQDSFSYAHTQRQPGTHEIEFLRVWEPVGKLVGGRLGATYSSSPTRHDADEPRDRAFVRNFLEVEGRPCRDLVEFPYTVPFACLSEEGDRARQAVVELLVLVRDLRKAHLASPAMRAHPSESRAWKAYKARWLASVYSCSGAECQERQPPPLRPASNLFLGVEGSYAPTAGTFGASVRGLFLHGSTELNPFVYALGVEVGYRRAYQVPANLGLLAVELDLLLPVGFNAAVGFTPAIAGMTFGSDRGNTEIGTRLLLFVLHPARGLWLGFRGPAEINWSEARVGWSFGLTVGLTPGEKETPPGALIRPAEERADRHDDEWAPEPLWYGRLKGRVASLYLVLGVTTSSAPVDSEPDTLYGLGGLGASIFWDRDHWGGRFPMALGGTLAIGERRTSGPARYLTAAASLEWRWYAFGVLGFSVVPVRLEAGPRVGGGDYQDPSPDVYGSPGSQHYFQAGTRLGLAFNAGVVDMLIQAPTLAWRSDPLQGGEVLSFQLGMRFK